MNLLRNHESLLFDPMYSGVWMHTDTSYYHHAEHSEDLLELIASETVQDFATTHGFEDMEGYQEVEEL